MCPTFNKIISRSPSLMKKLTVVSRDTLPENYKILVSSRKYRSLEISREVYHDWQQLSYFIENQEQTLENLTLHHVAKPWQNLKILSTVSEKLKKLRTIELPIEVPDAGFLEFSNLEHWSCSSTKNFSLNWFKTPKLKIFHFSKLCYEDAQVPVVSELVSFLRDQPQLKQLTVDSSLEVEGLLAAAELQPFPFRLIELEITQYGRFAESPRPVKIFQFLESQRCSLRALMLVDVILDNEDFNKIFTFELQELTLVDWCYHLVGPSKWKSQTIKKLCFGIFHYQDCINQNFIKTMINVIEACPKVEKLQIGHLRIEKVLSTSIASKLLNLNLKHLILISSGFDFPIHEMNQYPSLETFSAIRVDESAWKRYVAAKPELKNIRIGKESNPGVMCYYYLDICQ